MNLALLCTLGRLGRVFLSLINPPKLKYNPKMTKSKIQTILLKGFKLALHRNDNFPSFNLTNSVTNKPQIASMIEAGRLTEKAKQPGLRR